MQASSQIVIQTKALDMACEVSGPATAGSVILLHGWPDDARTWDRVLPTLHDAGWRTIVPYLRGFGTTRFRAPSIIRSGQLSALGQDVIDLANAMSIEKFAIIGHDWGARAAYIAAALLTQRVTHCVALSVGYGTNDPRQKLSLRQARNYWYHWYMALDFGEAAVRNDRKALTRFLWETWSPNWQISDAEFDVTAKSFDNPDWADVVLHSYRHRWGLVAGDHNYDDLEKSLNPAPQIFVPTLVIHGGSDQCNDPSTSEGRNAYFKRRYEREVLDGIGHFPQRESADVAQIIADFLATNA